MALHINIILGSSKGSSIIVNHLIKRLTFSKAQ